MTDIRLGTAGWSYDDWVGVFYPPGLPKGQYLEHYARYFRAVEVDSTFYAIPSARTVDRWADVTPDDFQFCPKLWQGITHEQQLQGSGDDVTRFLEALAPLGPKLGPIVIQLPPFLKAGPEARNTVASFLAELPEGPAWAIEFRDRKWVSEETFELLRRHRVAWVIQDLYYMPQVPEITADFSYFRWLGRRSEVSSFSEVLIDRTEELDEWAAVLQQVASRVRHLYGFFNNRYQGHSPASVRAMQQRLGMPTIQPSLFS